jgi:lipopolysaccharide biosynthesis glycosyltransferase
MSDVVYTINKQYIDLFRVSCQSLIDNSSIDLDIYVLTKYNEFSIEEQEKISQYFSSQRDNIKLTFITSDLFEKYNEEGRLYKSLWFGDTVFLRLFIHDALNKNWVTVLDADTIIVNNIDDLLTREYPMPIAGTLDLNYTKDTDYPYFCSAVYKVSLDYWRNKDINSKVLELLKEEYPFPEQDIMNRIFLYNKNILPTKYCVQNFHANLTQISAFHNPSIVHFGGPDKPNNKVYTPTTRYDYTWYELEFKTKKLKEELGF